MYNKSKRGSFNKSIPEAVQEVMHRRYKTGIAQCLEDSSFERSEINHKR